MKFRHKSLVYLHAYTRQVNPIAIKRVAAEWEIAPMIVERKVRETNLLTRRPDGRAGDVGKRENSAAERGSSPVAFDSDDEDSLGTCQYHFNIECSKFMGLSFLYIL